MPPFLFFILPFRSLKVWQKDPESSADLPKLKKSSADAYSNLVASFNIMDTFDNFQYENSSAYGGMSVIDDNSSVYTDNTREDNVSNIDLSSLSISDNASHSNGIGLVPNGATIDEDFDAVLDDLKEEGIVDLPPHACR